MKKTILTSAFVLLIACLIKAEELPADTAFQFNRKYIKVEEGNDRINVKVYETDESNDTIQYKQLYEGIFSDEKSYEKWTVQEAFGLDIPFLTKKKKHAMQMSSHWSGVGLGFANIADQSFNMTEVNGVSVNAGSSFEWFFNLLDGTLPLYRNNLGITTGAGMSWLNLRLDKNTHLVDADGVTGVYPAPEDIHYLLSRLMIVRINIPLLLEWQPTICGNHKAFLSAGVVAGIKTFSSYKVKYNNEDGKKVTVVEGRGLNTTPLFLDYMVQAGYDWLGVYAKYSPFSIFQSGKGPDVRAVSLGLILYFN
ncbi:MAG: PorT family protein [Candidatus Azobacteroides sp.]|nr:PorT family protein [Candidatus Azobacteroides sp.]